MVESSRPKVYVATRLPRQFLDQLAASCDCDCFQGFGPVPRPELLERLAEVEGLLCGATLPVDGEVIDAAKRLRVVSNIGVGFDNVDLGRATERGIAVTNTPDVLSDAVADLTMALILALARRLRESEQVVREGRWDASGVNVPMGSDLGGKTLAIIGMGRIGKAVAQRAAAFAMRLVYYDVRPEAKPKVRARRCGSLDEALALGDFVTIHVNLTPETHHLIGANQVAAMKPTAYLVNTSRGQVVDQSALSEALRQGRLAGAALDVLEQEPPDPSEPLLALPSVIITPHAGTATRETRLAMVQLAIRNLIDCLCGEGSPCIVNPEVLAGGPDRR
ncbi:MAG: D-glycerate dehydrogenase [Chloroflexi bacterium]|nr:D-glycerate dehydrogenase [Chloroflexota bacterium]